MNIDVTYIPNLEGIFQSSLFSATSYYNASVAGQGLVFGLTRSSNENAGPYWPGYPNTASNNQGGVNLNIRVQPNDKVRLRTNSLTAGFKYQCFIQSIALYEKSITASAHKCEAIPATSRTTTGAVAVTQVFDDYWELTVGDKLGYEQCTINFSIFDSNATRIGGFFTYLYVNWPGESPYSIQ
ncbi:AidA/PixA family protein [Trinickia dinghuensis]|uniref:Inclusion body protein n=1 Tax=Trinickia dinghuensis TaxID=2291023 RepID=A0A3D8JZT4_9BURK|nr:AidA/PixA family protein [Trinickia dinghuensis]RDU98673.1 hypothetical protein DWV00_10355 [Trinickia dinghuensis]